MVCQQLSCQKKKRGNSAQVYYRNVARPSPAFREGLGTNILHYVIRPSQLSCLSRSVGRGLSRTQCVEDPNSFLA